MFCSKCIGFKLTDILEMFEQAEWVNINDFKDEFSRS